MHPTLSPTSYRHPALDAGSIFLNMDAALDRKGLVRGIYPPKRIIHTPKPQGSFPWNISAKTARVLSVESLPAKAVLFPSEAHKALINHQSTSSFPQSKTPPSFRLNDLHH